MKACAVGGMMAGVLFLLTAGAVNARPEGGPKPKPDAAARARQDGWQNAAGNMGHGRMLERIIAAPEIVEALALEPTQVASVREALEEMKLREFELRAALEKAAREQAQLLMQEAFEEDDLMRAIERTGAIRTRLAKQRMQPLLIMKRILTRDQLDKARSLLRRRLTERKRKDGGQASAPRGIRDRAKALREGDAPGAMDRGQAARERKPGHARSRQRPTREPSDD